MSERLAFCKAQRSKYPEAVGIHPSVPIPDWVVIGERVYIGVGVTFSDYPFGYAYDPIEKRYLHIPHRGGLVIGDEVELHTGVIVDRGTVNDTRIGAGTKVDRNVHVAHNANVGSGCLLESGTTIAGSVRLGDNVICGIGVMVCDHVSIADGVRIGAGSVVLRDITEPWTVHVGVPARKIRARRADEMG